jgi:hypothetical protein
MVALLETVLLEVAGEHLWRVSDRNITSGPKRFMAFIEEKNEQFEVAQATDDFEWTTLPTLWDALAHVLQTRRGRPLGGGIDETAPRPVSHAPETVEPTRRRGAGSTPPAATVR